MMAIEQSRDMVIKRGRITCDERSRIMEKELQAFMEHGKLEGLKENTIGDHGRTLADFFDFVNDNYPDVKEITDVSRDMILSYEKYLVTKTDARKKTISRDRRRRYLSNLRSFFSYLEKE